MSVEEMIKEIVKEFKSDPRNKVFAHQALMLASAKEECGEDLSPEALRSLIEDYGNGSLDERMYELFDCVVSSFSELANRCFGENPYDEDEEVDYQVSFIENWDDTFSAEIRPM